MSLLRLLQGHGFFNTGVYRVELEYPVHEITLVWSDGETEDIRCNKYSERPIGITVEQLDDIYCKHGYLIRTSFTDQRTIVTSSLDEYRINRRVDCETVETEVEMSDMGLFRPSVPRREGFTRGDMSYELCEVK